MKIKITEGEKKEILELHNNKKKNIQEQSWLRNLIGSSVDDLIKLYGDDAVKSFETHFAKSLRNLNNVRYKEGKTFLRTLNGNEISLDEIEELLKLVAQGKMSSSDAAKLLPRRLADGFEFKEFFERKFSQKIPIKNTESTISKEEPSISFPTKKSEELEIITSGLRGGFKATNKKAFDVRQSNEIMQHVMNNDSFADIMEYKGKKYVVVGLKLENGERVSVSGRDNYSFASTEYNENTPKNIVEILEKSAKENFKNVYPNFDNIIIKPITEKNPKL